MAIYFYICKKVYALLKLSLSKPIHHFLFICVCVCVSAGFFEIVIHICAPVAQYLPQIYLVLYRRAFLNLKFSKCNVYYSCREFRTSKIFFFLCIYFIFHALYYRNDVQYAAHIH